jgi:peroxiredoxin
MAAAAFLLLIFGAFPPPESVLAADAAQGMVGTQAPAFTVKSVDGADLSLASLLSGGTVVVVNFWGIRCAPCILELGAFNELLPRLEGKNVRFLAFNTDGIAGNELVEAMKENNIVSRCVVVADPEFKVMDAYKMKAAPLTYVVGKDGKILYEHVDYKPGDEKELEKQIEAALVK